MNPVALVTGASRGIGRGIAVELARLGYDLVLNFASNRTAAEESQSACLQAAQAAGRALRVEPVAADVSVAADRARLLEFTREQFGRLDFLVNNAGVAPVVRSDILETTEGSFDRLLGINLKGPYFLTQLAARWMVKQVEESDGKQRIPPPRIVFISSLSTYAASTNRGEYCISKAGVAMMTALFAARLADHGIGVYEIRPGIIQTDMTAPARARYDALIQEGLTPIRRWGTPQDVGLAVAAIAQGLLPFSTGEVLNVDGGFHLRRL